MSEDQDRVEQAQPDEEVTNADASVRSGQPGSIEHGSDAPVSPSASEEAKGDDSFGEPTPEGPSESEDSKDWEADDEDAADSDDEA